MFIEDFYIKAGDHMVSSVFLNYAKNHNRLREKNTSRWVAYISEYRGENNYNITLLFL